VTITNGYITAQDLKRAKGIVDFFDDDLADAAISAASRAIDDMCGRRFYADTSVSARLYVPPRNMAEVLNVDDFWTTSGLVVSDNGTTRTVGTDIQLEPQGVIGAQSGYPYTGFRPMASFWSPALYQGQYTVTVTAKWGWAAVPTDVKNACRRLAQMRYEARNAPFGVAGFGDMGAMRFRYDSIVKELLPTYGGGTFGIGG
jgi:hypothetical protein